MNIYRITFWKILKPNIILILNLVLFLVLMGGLMIMIYQRDGYIPTFLIALTAICGLIIFVPQFILCVNYYKNDRKRELLIDEDNEEFSILKDGRKKSFLFKDIVKVVKIAASYSKLKGIDSIATWRHFYTYKIELKDKSFVYLTSFLIQNLEKTIPNLQYEYLKQRFPMIKKNKNAP